MSSFFVELWESIFTPGTTPTLLLATNVTFAALQVVLGLMLYATYSIHFLVLSVLCGGLWYSINWFARELKVYQQQEEDKARRVAATLPALESSDSETEVEVSKSVESIKKGGKPQPKPVATSSEIEPVEQHGELKLRVTDEKAESVSSQDIKSSVSTEDEWEKVSENEKEKDK
ncbi:ER protein Pkr1-domain-containing protein [Cladorrhinum sp. PSN332]|nr:ER protein Pkr1-domain-containing protein [Cladorrhinum sp. PSN332]